MVKILAANGKTVFEDSGVMPNSLVFAIPIYFYEMSGQMKTLLDRAVKGLGS